MTSATAPATPAGGTARRRQRAAAGRRPRASAPRPRSGPGRDGGAPSGRRRRRPVGVNYPVTQGINSRVRPGFRETNLDGVVTERFGQPALDVVRWVPLVGFDERDVGLVNTGPFS